MLARNDLFFGFPNKLKAHFGAATSTRLASALSRLDLTDDRLSIAARSASDGSAVIIILLFALRLRSGDVLDAYYVAWYLYLYLYVVVSIPHKRSNSRELAHILAFNKKLALKRRVERDLCAALASSCCLGILLV